MDEKHLVVAIIVAAIALIGRIVFDWLKGDKEKREITCPLDRSDAISDIKWLKDRYGGEMAAYQETADNVEWLKDVHDQKDEDGVPKWFVPKSLTKLTRASYEKNIAMVQLLTDIKEILKENQGLLREIKSDKQ